LKEEQSEKQDNPNIIKEIGILSFCKLAQPSKQ
jgi:hypothetical protein